MLVPPPLGSELLRDRVVVPCDEKLPSAGGELVVCPAGDDTRCSGAGLVSVVEALCDLDNTLRCSPSGDEVLDAGEKGTLCGTGDTSLCALDRIDISSD